MNDTADRSGGLHIMFVGGPLAGTYRRVDSTSHFIEAAEPIHMEAAGTWNEKLPDEKVEVKKVLYTIRTLRVTHDIFLAAPKEVSDFDLMMEVLDGYSAHQDHLRRAKQPPF